MSSRKEILQLFKNREYLGFLSMRVFLTLALQVQAVIVGWQIFKLTQDPLSLGLIGLAEAIPALSVALYAGHIADISSKKKILTLALLGILFCSCGLLLVTTDEFIIGFSESLSVKAMYSFIFLSGIARGFYAPAGFSFLSQIVPREVLANASTLNSSSWQIAAIVGPALGGILYAAMGITNTFAIVLVLACMAFGSLLLFVKPRPAVPQPGNEGIASRLREGVRFVFDNKVVLGAISLDLFAVLFGGAVALLPIFASDILKVGAEGLGMLRAAPSLGASITMIWLSFNRPRRNPGILLLYCVGGFGLCMIAFGLSTSFYLSLFILFLSGAFDSVSVVIRSNILQLQTPDHMRGRVSAVNTMFIGSSNEIGAFESGLAAKLLGTVNSVVFGGSMTMLVVGVAALKAKALKRFKY